MLHEDPRLPGRTMGMINVEMMEGGGGVRCGLGGGCKGIGWGMGWLGGWGCWVGGGRSLFAASNSPRTLVVIEGYNVRMRWGVGVGRDDGVVGFVWSVCVGWCGCGGVLWGGVWGGWGGCGLGVWVGWVVGLVSCGVWGGGGGGGGVKVARSR